MRSLTLRSPAKLNLFLKVINKRPDGYHNIRTLYERIGLCDTVHLALNKTGVIRIFSKTPGLPKGKANLAYQSAYLLKKRYHLNLGVDIKITKKIPIAAGLGGGSSNAATVLMGLNQLWRLSLSTMEI